MGKPIRRGGRPAPSPDDHAGRERFFASDVLLIAEPGTGRTSQRADEGRIDEPLDMESVVRKLIALLSEQGPA